MTRLPAFEGATNDMRRRREPEADAAATPAAPVAPTRLTQAHAELLNSTSFRLSRAQEWADIVMLVDSLVSGELQVVPTKEIETVEKRALNIAESESSLEDRNDANGILRHVRRWLGRTV